MKGLIWLAALLILLGGVRFSPERRATFDEEEVKCEEAVAHLAECCGNLHAKQFFCEFISGNGCGGGREPDFDISESRFVRDQSCAELNQNDVCAWAADVAAHPDITPSEESL